MVPVVQDIIKDMVDRIVAEFHFCDSDSFSARAAHPSTLEHKIEREGVLLYG